MKILIFSLLILGVSCAKSGKGGSEPQIPEVKPAVVASEVTEIPSFDVEILKAKVDEKRVVLFSENLKEITSVTLEIENAHKIEASLKTVTLKKKICYNNAALDTGSGVWNFYFHFYCSDEASYHASPAKAKYPQYSFLPNSSLTLDMTHRTWNPWVNIPFEDDLTLEDLGIEVFINDKFVPIGSKDISIHDETGEVLKLTVALDLPQSEDGNLKIIANPVYPKSTIKTGVISPTLYPCKPSVLSNLTAYVKSSSLISNGICKERTSSPENYIWFEGGIASKTESDTTKNEFDLKFSVKAIRQGDAASPEEEQ